MDCSLPGSSVRGIFQARVLEWGAIAFSLFSHGLPLFVPDELLGATATKKAIKMKATVVKAGMGLDSESYPPAPQRPWWACVTSVKP